MMSSQVTCGNCGSNEVEFESSRGDTYCTRCGFVIDQNCIVSEVLFSEGTHGSNHIIGQRHDTESAFKSFSIGGILGAGRESRQVTLMNAKRRIKTVCDQLRLNDHFIEMAFNFYKMALNRRLTHGRKHVHVIAACIYITCRSEGTPHMLLDLSDVSQVNVYELGRTYLKLTAALCITIPAIDPSLYIIRFAQHLNLGEKTNTDVEKMRNNVISTANRLVQRMKRDWMHYGRRPSGLCGAAILVAARLHEVHCSIKDIIKVVKVCETTIRKRLCEFSETPTSNLTLDEFMTIDLEGEEDPPCFKANKRKQKLCQFENEQQLEEIQTKISHLQKLIEKDLEKSRQKLRNPFSKYLRTETTVSLEPKSEDSAVEQFILDDTVHTIEKVLTDENTNNYDNYMQSIKCLRPTAASLGITSVIEPNDTNCDQKDGQELVESEELDLTGIDDTELDGYLLSSDEIDAKTNVWTRVHREYLDELKLKEQLKAKEDEERKRKEASGEVLPKKKRKSRKKTQIQANSASEAIEKMLLEKKISNKINYEVLKNLNPTFGQMSENLKTAEPLVKSSDKCVEFEDQKSIQSPLKRLTTLKNSGNTSLVNLKAPLFNKLKIKSLDSKPNSLESNDANDSHVLSKPLETKQESKAIDLINNELEEESEDEDDDKRKEFSIQELLGLESADNDLDNHYYEYEDEDY
ncbi:unnamed protein product [Medioppia subpectinata]|uniref:B-related factor 1 n=1 Tax=Medioppia subpectinata TaxID=1979941 RepID=A0A7R9PVJ2_9ACAR|nr:unnamed protein product [Medioppia subpectinata]CAG2102705.1 unnamed protein product [Medioppia subpectinata]